MDETRRGRFESSSSETASSAAGAEGDESPPSYNRPNNVIDDMSSLGFRGIDDQSMDASSVLQHSVASSLWAARRRSDIPLTISEGDERNSQHNTSSRHESQHGSNVSPLVQESSHSSRSEMTMGAGNLSNRSLNVTSRKSQRHDTLEALRKRPIVETIDENDGSEFASSRPNSTENTEPMPATDYLRTTRTTNQRSSLGMGTVFTAMSIDTDNQTKKSTPSPELSIDGTPSVGSRAYSSAPRNPDDVDATLFNGSFIMQDSGLNLQVADDGTAATMESNQRFFDEKSLESPTNDEQSDSMLKDTMNARSSPQPKSVKDDVTAFTMGSNTQYFGRSTPSTVGGDRSTAGGDLSRVKTPSPPSYSISGRRKEETSPSLLARGRASSRDDATAFTMGSNLHFFGRSTPTSTLGGGRSEASISIAKTPSPISALGSQSRQSPAPSLANTNISGPNRELRSSPGGMTNSLHRSDVLSFLKELRADAAVSPNHEAELHSVMERSLLGSRSQMSDMQSQADTAAKISPPAFQDTASYCPREHLYQAENNSISDDDYGVKKTGDQSTGGESRTYYGSSSHLDRSIYSNSASAIGSQAPMVRKSRKASNKGDSSVASTKSSGSSATTPYLLRPPNVRPHTFEASEVEVSMDGFLHPSKQAFTSEDDMAKTYTDAKSYRSQARSYYDGEYRGDDFTYVDESLPHAIPGMRSRMILIFALTVLLGTSIFFASRVGPFYVSPETVITQEKAASQLRLSRIRDQAGIQSSSASSGSTASSGSGSSGSSGAANTGAPATSGLTTLGSSGVVVNSPQQETARSNKATDAVFSPQLEASFTTWGTPYGGLGKELPFVWSFELSGGDVVQQVFGQCLGKVQAANGADFDTGNVFGKYWVANHLKVVTVHGQHFINVDTFSPVGIDRAVQLQLAQAHVAEVMVSPYLHEASKVFQTQNIIGDNNLVTGRLMIIFRDPLKRAFNRFEEIRRAQGTDFSLMKYAESDVYNENNPLTRAILGLSKSDPLDDKALKTVYKFIDKRVFVGLFEEMDETLKRFERFFGWHVPSDMSCHDHVKQEWATIYSLDDTKYDVTDPSAFNMIVAQHRMDLKVYRHVKTKWIKQLEQLTQTS